MGLLQNEQAFDAAYSKIHSIFSRIPKRYSIPIGKRIYKFCSTCEVRKCGLERGVANCGYCTEYPCEKLERLWKGFRTVSGEEAKASLDNVRRLGKHL